MRFSLRNRASSSRSAVVSPVLPRLRSARAWLTHVANEDGVRSSSRATAPTDFPSSHTSRTAPVRNSSVNCRRARRPALLDPILDIVPTFRKMSTESDQAQYEALFTYVTFASVLFGTLGGVAIFVLRAKQPDTPRPYRALGYPVIPALYVLGSFALVWNTLMERPTESIAGLGLVALGLPFYFYWSRPARA